jgi:hypothetical protein
MASQATGGSKFIGSLSSHSVAVEVRLPKHPGLALVNELLDPSDGNMSFKNQKDSDKLADQHLIPKLAAHPKNLSDDDWRLILVMLGVRNALAHSSNQSIKSMNSAMVRANGAKDVEVKSLGRPKQPISRAGIGSYLLAGPSGVRRVEVVCRRILALHNTFR